MTLTFKKHTCKGNVSLAKILKCILSCNDWHPWNLLPNQSIDKHIFIQKERYLFWRYWDTHSCYLTDPPGSSYWESININQHISMQRKGISFEDIEIHTLATWRTPLEAPTESIYEQTYIHAEGRYLFRRYWDALSCKMTDAHLFLTFQI